MSLDAQMQRPQTEYDSAKLYLFDHQMSLTDVVRAIQDSAIAVYAGGWSTSHADVSPHLFTGVD